MYHPTTRLLTILELLQAHTSLSGAALARRLEVEPRSVRRYITMLQDMGMPIEAVRGPGGGYQLRPGFKLPPLLFSEEEATAIVLGLLSHPWLQVGHSPVAVEGALAKVLRVLPVRARERLSAMSANLVLSPHEQEGRPDAKLLLDLSEAIQLRRRVALDYRSHLGEATHRTVEPYGLAGWWNQWYMVAYCCLRQGYRLFRLDRVQSIEMLAENFTRSESFDTQAYVREHLAKQSARWSIKVVFQVPLQSVRQKIPTGYGTLTETPDGVLFETSHGDLADVARFLAARNLPFVVLDPPELRAELLRLAEWLSRSAAGSIK
jgi:predicted DNA-binding transcriptional regulator YafY